MHGSSVGGSRDRRLDRAPSGGPGCSGPSGPSGRRGRCRYQVGRDWTCLAGHNRSPHPLGHRPAAEGSFGGYESISCGWSIQRQQLRQNIASAVAFRPIHPRRYYPEGCAETTKGPAIPDGDCRAFCDRDLTGSDRPTPIMWTRDYDASHTPPHIPAAKRSPLQVVGDAPAPIPPDRCRGTDALHTPAQSQTKPWRPRCETGRRRPLCLATGGSPLAAL